MNEENASHMVTLDWDPLSAFATLAYCESACYDMAAYAIQMENGEGPEGSLANWNGVAYTPVVLGQAYDIGSAGGQFVHWTTVEGMAVAESQSDEEASA